MILIGIVIFGLFAATINSASKLDSALREWCNAPLSLKNKKRVENHTIVFALSLSASIGLLIAWSDSTTQQTAIDTISKKLNKPIIREEVITTNVIYRVAVEK